MLNWAEQVTVGSQGNYKPVGKRAAAIAKASAYANSISVAYAHAYTLAIASTYAYTFITIVYPYTNIIANAIGFAIIHARELEKLKIFNNLNFTVLIARLEALKARIPDDKQLQEVHRVYFESIQEIWLQAYHLTPEMIDLSEEEAQALANYLYANHLIIQCKQAAVRVSPTTWEAIEARMLLLPSS